MYLVASAHRLKITSCVINLSNMNAETTCSIAGCHSVVITRCSNEAVAVPRRHTAELQCAGSFFLEILSAVLH
jgi:hypothetical protein